MINEQFSDFDDTNDIYEASESDNSSDSDTEILSDTEIAACMPSTYHDSISMNKFWMRTLEDLEAF